MSQKDDRVGSFETERFLKTNSRFMLVTRLGACRLRSRSRSIRDSDNSSRQPGLGLFWFGIYRILRGGLKRNTEESFGLLVLFYLSLDGS